MLRHLINIFKTHCFLTSCSFLDFVHVSVIEENLITIAWVYLLTFVLFRLDKSKALLRALQISIDTAYTIRVADISTKRWPASVPEYWFVSVNIYLQVEEVEPVLEALCLCVFCKLIALPSLRVVCSLSWQTTFQLTALMLKNSYIKSNDWI